jgi:hypothetical protein
MRFLFVAWQVLAIRRMVMHTPIRRLGFLPTVCRLPAVAYASCLFLTSYPSGMMTHKEITGTQQRGLSPHKITPMLGVLHGRTGVAFSGLFATRSPVPRDFQRYAIAASPMNWRTSGSNMKCELCDSDATFHMTTVDPAGNALSRALCEDHGRQIVAETGLQFPSNEEFLSDTVANAKRLAGFLRTNRRMPTSDDMMDLSGTIDLPRRDSDKQIDVFIAYLDSLAEFITRNDRFPTEDELRDPF